MQLFSDQVAMLLDTYQSKGVKIALSRAIQAVNQAYRRIGSCATWSYLHRRTQVNTSAPYSTGTVAYTASTRTLTLTGGTWPTWAVKGIVLINGNIYAVHQRVSSTALTLMSGRAPVDNIAALTTYSIYQTEYVLPSDYVRTEELVPIGQWWALRERAPGSILQTARLFYTPSRPFEFSVRGSLHTPGRMAIEFGPPPDAAYTLDLSYYAQPRPRTLSSESKTGVIAVSGTAVTGTGTAFTSAMAGCRLRQGTSSSAPVGEYGEQGSLAESTILSVTDATHLTLVDAGVDATEIQYIIDDPVDIDRGSMDEVFCRFCESEFERIGHLDGREKKEQEAIMALMRAKAMDVRLSPRQQFDTSANFGIEAMIYSGVNHR